jgi:hypothetical protein
MCIRFAVNCSLQEMQINLILLYGIKSNLTTTDRQAFKFKRLHKVSVDFKLSINQIIVSMLCAELQMIQIVEVFPHLSLLVGGRIMTVKPSLLCNAHPLHLAFPVYFCCTWSELSWPQYSICLEVSLSHIWN